MITSRRTFLSSLAAAAVLPVVGRDAMATASDQRVIGASAPDVEPEFVVSLRRWEAADGTPLCRALVLGELPREALGIELSLYPNHKDRSTCRLLGLARSTPFEAFFAPSPADWRLLTLPIPLAVYLLDRHNRAYEYYWPKVMWGVSQ